MGFQGAKHPTSHLHATGITDIHCWPRLYTWPLKLQRHLPRYLHTFLTEPSPQVPPYFLARFFCSSECPPTHYVDEDDLDPPASCPQCWGASRASASLGPLFMVMLGGGLRDRLFEFTCPLGEDQGYEALPTPAAGLILPYKSSSDSDLNIPRGSCVRLDPKPVCC